MKMQGKKVSFFHDLHPNSIHLNISTSEPLNRNENLSHKLCDSAGVAKDVDLKN